MQNSNVEEKRFLKETGVHKMTDISLPKLRNDRSAGKGIPYYKVGRLVRYALADVISYMEQWKVKTENE